MPYYSANRLTGFCLKFTYFISFCLQQDSIFKPFSRLLIKIGVCVEFLSSFTVVAFFKLTVWYEYAPIATKAVFMSTFDVISSANMKSVADLRFLDF